MTLLTAGFCSSGIFGIDGVWTKLKYHSRPIHITPESTWSQRKKNAHHACWLTGAHCPVPRPARMRMTTRRTTPATRVLLSDEKNAAILLSPFCCEGFGEKSLAEKPRGRSEERQHLR